MSNLYRVLFWIFIAVLLCTATFAQNTAAAKQASTRSTLTTKETPVPAYQLSGDKLRKAIEVSRTRAVLHFIGAGWNIAAMLMLLVLGVPAKFRDWALAASTNRWVQCLVFFPLFALTLTLISLPVDVYAQHVQRIYSLSVQSWPGWIWDQIKEFLIFLATFYLPVMLLFLVLRRSPRRWWLWFWAASVPLTIFFVFISPVLLEPLMNKYEPLAQSNPALTNRLERIVAHGGIEIPRERMFLMKASNKTTQLNAYVTGVGASKRVVVWDTAIVKATPDEVSFIFGHEMGHYVLHHIWLGIAFGCTLSFVGFWLAFHFVNWAVARYGTAWRIESTQDWAVLAVLALALTVLTFIGEPVANGFSRWAEHQADIYGQEAIHGIVSDPPEIARKAFQVLGENSLVDPEPNPFVEFWTGSHPSLASRAAFARSYDPWRPGEQPKYFRKNSVRLILTWCTLAQPGRLCDQVIAFRDAVCLARGNPVVRNCGLRIACHFQQVGTNGVNPVMAENSCIRVERPQQLKPFGWSLHHSYGNRVIEQHHGIFVHPFQKLV